MKEISRFNLTLLLFTALVTLGIILTSIFSLKTGIFEIFPYFFIIPVLLIIFTSPRVGVIFSVFLGLIYVGLVFLYGPPDILAYATGIAWFYILISLAVVISAFANEITGERKFRDLFLNSQAGIFTFHMKNQNIIMSNPKISSILGYSPEEMNHLTISALLPDNTEIEGFFGKLKSEKKISDVEMTLQRKEGIRVWVLVTASLTSGDEALCSVVDITERKRIRDELKYTEIHYRTLFDSAGDAMIIYDFEGNIYEANTLASILTGYSYAELFKMTMADLNPGDTDETKSAVIRELRRKGSILRETTIQTKDNRMIPIEMSSNVIEYYRSPSIISILRDITARKRAETALRESESRYRMIGDLIPFGVWVANADGLLTYASQSFLDLINMSIDECQVETWMKMLPNENRESTINDWKHCVESGSFWDYEYRIPDSKGTDHYILSRGAPLRDSSGRVLSWAGIHFDITERRRNENRIEASLKEKEVIIKELHHRVKNNMQVISGFLQLQSQYIEDQDSVEKLEECQNRVKTMALVHEKLYQTKYLGYINAREYIESLISDLMNSYVLDTHISMNIDIENVNINLDTAIPCGLILNELITNSIKYAFRDRESGSISVGLHLSQDHFFTLDVRDDGMGLPKNLDIANASTLGLQLVAVLVRQLGGEMHVEGNSGARFFITFPEKF